MIVVYERFGPDLATTGAGFLISLACLAAGIGLTLQHHARLRRPLRGRCYACNYDLSGLPVGAPCPECGEPPLA